MYMYVHIKSLFADLTSVIWTCELQVSHLALMFAVSRVVTCSNVMSVKKKKKFWYGLQSHIVTNDFFKPFFFLGGGGVMQINLLFEKMFT